MRGNHDKPAGQQGGSGVTPAGADIVLRMYQGALSSVAARAAWAEQCREAAGVTAAEYEAMTFEQQERVIRTGRRRIEQTEKP